MNLSMYYIMLRSAIKGKAELSEVNHALMMFDRLNQSFKLSAKGIDKKQLVEREFEEMKNDAITNKLADGVIDYLKIKGNVTYLTMDVDFILKTTTVVATVTENGVSKRYKYSV